MHHLSDSDWQGHDNYERVSGKQRSEHGMNYEHVGRGNVFEEYSPYDRVGVPSMRGMGGGPFDIPSIPSVIDVLYEGPVRYIGITHKLPVITALEYLSLSQDTPDGSDPLTGHAMAVAFSTGQAWVSYLVSLGYVVMVGWPLDPTKTIPVIASKTPATIAQYATDAGGYMVVDGPQALVVQAGALAAQQGGQVAPPPGTAPGTMPGTSPFPGASTAVTVTSGMPGWVLPVVIGVGALGILAVVSMAKSKKSSGYAMNRKRKRHHKNGRKCRRSKTGI